MISLYTGTPGSGKSLHLAERLYWRIKNKRGLVICNFEVALENIKGYGKHKSEFLLLDNDELTAVNIEKIVFDYAKRHNKPYVKEGEILLVIDECQLIFNSRDWQRGDRNGWLKFFTQHRKYGIDVILVAQFDRMIDRQIRSLVEYEWIHRKVSNFGFWGKLVAFIFAGGNLFTCAEIWYPMKEKISAYYFKGKQKYFDIYDTRKMFDGAMQCAGGIKGTPEALDSTAQAEVVKSKDLEKLVLQIKKFEEEKTDERKE
ncbi:MAG: zonular occludens toxin domain-containing protein [Lachnospiraceae bacterium]|nr:zonular occludens toxin domain-containing protein [Lachnospiraceae bacterium]